MRRFSLVFFLLLLLPFPLSSHTPYTPQKIKEILSQAQLYLIEGERYKNRLKEAQILWRKGRKVEAEEIMGEVGRELERRIEEEKRKARARRDTPLSFPFGVMGLPTAKLLEVPWVRIGVIRTKVEEAPGVYRWERSLLKKAEVLGFHQQVVLRWGNNKGWGGVSLPPEDLEENYSPEYGYSRNLYLFVHHLLKENRGIKILVVENEANAPNFWGGTPQEYIKVLKTVYKSAHETEPGVKIANSGCASPVWGILIAWERWKKGEEGEEICRFLREYLGEHPAFQGKIPQNNQELARFFKERTVQEMIEKVEFFLEGVKGCLDLFNFHYYEKIEFLPLVVEWIRKEMRARGYEYPLICNEFGVRKKGGLSDEELAKEIFRCLVVARACGIQWIFWFPYDSKNGQVGILKKRWELKELPAYTFRLVTSLLDERYTLERKEEREGISLYYFRNNGKGKVDLIAFWGKGGNIYLNLTQKPSRIEEIKYDGERLPLSPSSYLTLPPEPGFLRID